MIPSEKSIFTVTVVRGTQDPPNKPFGRKRCWCWYASFVDAQQSIVANDLDMFEDGYYDYAVIEEVLEGMGSRVKVLSWYHADYMNDESRKQNSNPIVKHIATPEWAKGVICWGLG